MAASLLLAASGLARGKELIAHGLLIDLAAIKFIAHELDEFKRSAQEPLIDGFGTNDIIEQKLQFFRVNAAGEQWVHALFA